MPVLINLQTYEKYYKSYPIQNLSPILDDKKLFVHLGLLCMLNVDDTYDILFNKNQTKELYIGCNTYVILHKDDNGIQIRAENLIERKIVKYLLWLHRLLCGNEYKYSIYEPDYGINREYVIVLPDESLSVEHPTYFNEFFDRWSRIMFACFGLSHSTRKRKNGATCKLRPSCKINIQNNPYPPLQLSIINERCSFTPKIIKECKLSQYYKCAICREFTNTGEVAHIVGGTRNSPRYYLFDESTKTMTSKDISGFRNGVYLCRNCHEYIDNKTTSSHFTVSTLRVLKWQSRTNNETDEFEEQPKVWLDASVKAWQRKRKLLTWLELELETSTIFTEKVIAVIDELIDPQNMGSYDYLRIICKLFHLLPLDKINHDKLDSQIYQILTFIDHKFKDDRTIFNVKDHNQVFNGTTMEKLFQPIRLNNLLETIKQHLQYIY